MKSKPDQSSKKENKPAFIFNKNKLFWSQEKPRVSGQIREKK